MVLSTLFIVDAAIRFAGVGVLLLLSAVLIRDARQSWAGRITAAFTASVAVYLLCSYGPVREVAGVVLPLLLFICLAVPFLLWLAALSIFIDGFKPRPLHFGALVVIEILGFASIALRGDPRIWVGLTALLHHACAIALYAHALYVAWSGHGDDLIKARREFRRTFIGSVALLGVIVAGVEIVHVRGVVPAGLESAAALAILILSFTLALVAIRTDPGRLFLASPGQSGKEPAMGTEALQPGERHTLGLVRKAIEEDHLYRQDGLTITALAQAIGVPEHHLRRVINAGLGYRNFNAFLNHYRIEDVRLALAAPAKARIPILTIALNTGYRSLAPFNRAFKELVGLTPSAYRKLKLGASATDDASPD